MSTSPPKGLSRPDNLSDDSSEYLNSKQKPQLSRPDGLSQDSLDNSQETKEMTVEEMDALEQKCKIFVGGIKPEMEEDEITNLFS